jgi:signal transduction histidine kinase
LYICQKNVEDLGGRIEVESQVGEGTTFTVWLPC